MLHLHQFPQLICLFRRAHPTKLGYVLSFCTDTRYSLRHVNFYLCDPCRRCCSNVHRHGTSNPQKFLHLDLVDSFTTEVRAHVLPVSIPFLKSSRAGGVAGVWSRIRAHPSIHLVGRKGGFFTDAHGGKHKASGIQAHTDARSCTEAWSVHEHTRSVCIGKTRYLLLTRIHVKTATFSHQK